MSKLFEIIGLRHPGKVNLFQFGTVDLFNLSDEKLLKIYQADPKIKYLRPTEAGLQVLYPGQQPIELKANPLNDATADAARVTRVDYEDNQTTVENQVKPKKTRKPKPKP